MATTKTANTTNPTPRKSVMEMTLDRVLTRRLRPLRDELKAARLSAEEQVSLRIEAEKRVVRAENAADLLRVQVADLTRELSALQQPAAVERPASWWRRRRALEEQSA